MFDFSPSERLELLLVFADQLSTYWKFRDRIDARLDRLGTLRKQHKQYLLWDAQQEREASNARFVIVLIR